MPEERKLVTVLFADVTGSTALGEDLDPEDVRALMRRYYEHARDIVAAHDGTLEKFIGDAVMAIFGLPHAHGDDAERAVASGRALQAAIANDPELTGMELRIGINTGEVVATSDPTAGDFLVTGDAVNVAARLQQHAAPGEILASERTYAAAGAVFVFGDSRTVEVKGKREPLRVFPVVGARDVRQAARPPMVGRDDDLIMLSLLYRRTVREGKPQLVSIVAPAGTGKTRLLEEFLAGLGSNRPRLAVSRCLPYGQTLTFWPLRGLMEELLGGVERDRVIETFQAAGHNSEDASRLADLVLSTLGMEGETLTERESVFNAWRLLIEAIAHQGSLLVVFEDLHWASDSLLDLVEQIMQPRTRAPLLVIAISRPELLDRRPSWGASARQNVTTLVLEPLAEEQTEELVEQIGPGLPEAIRRTIVERSGGNPFFVTELVRGLAERGIGAGEHAADAVPDTVHAAVLARLDLLEPAERRVLQAAAVGGRLFRPAIVQAMLSDLGSRDLDSAIDDLLARDLIVPDEGGAFTFRHILIRDVAYGTLSRAERARMHITVAAWLEDFAADRFDEYVELIAYHYREAVVVGRRPGGAVTTDVDVVRAVAALERAGEIAGRSGATTEARRYLESAIDLADERDRGRLYEKLGDGMATSDAGLDAYRETLERWRQAEAGDLETGARLLRKMLVSHLRWLTGQGSVTLESLAAMRDEALRLAEAVGEDERWRSSVIDVAWPRRAVFSGDAGVTIADEERQVQRDAALAAAAYFEERGEWDMVSTLLDGFMWHSLHLGRWDDVITAARRRLAAPELPAIERGDAIHMIAWAHRLRGDPEESLRVALDAIASSRPGDPISHFQSLIWDGVLTAYWSGHWSDLAVFIRVAEEIRQQLQDEWADGVLVYAYILWLSVAMARDDRATADAALAIIQRLCRERRQPYLAVAEALRADDPSLLNLDPADLQDGWGLVLWFSNDRGLSVSSDLMQYEQAHDSDEAGPSFVPAALAIRDHDPARLAAAIDQAEGEGRIPDVARMRIVLAEMTGDPGPLELARPVLEQLQDRQFLRRLDGVAASLR